MPAPPCLSDESLELLSAGRLNDVDAPPCEDHLRECPDCAERMRVVRTDDPLVSLSRRAGRIAWSGEEAVAASELIRRCSNRSLFTENRGREATVVADGGLEGHAPGSLRTLPGGAARETAEVESRAAEISSVPHAGLSWPTVAPSPGTSATKEEAPTHVNRVHAGALLDAYRLEAKLGEGAMGAVWKAFHTKLKKHVAIKLLSPRLLRDGEMVARFEREIEQVGRLDHPGIVRAMDAGEWEGFHYLVMEYVEGQDLAKFVKTSGPRSVKEACEIVRQAAVGLAHAHQSGLVHRDVKPSNLFLTRDGRVKVLDLGLARLHRDPIAPDADAADSDAAGPDTGLTAFDQVLGTPDFMAPEQWQNARAAGPASDLYALGCTLFYLLTGRPPFGTDRHQTLLLKMRAHLEEPAPALAAERAAIVAAANRPGAAGSSATTVVILDDVPPDVEAIYQRLMAKEPPARFASADDLAAALAERVVDRSAIQRGIVMSGSTPAPNVDPFATIAPAAREDAPRQTGTGGRTAAPSTAPRGAPTMATRPNGPRTPARSAVRIALGCLGAAVLLGAIVITIRHRDGSKTTIETDADDEVTIEHAKAPADSGSARKRSIRKDPPQVRNPQPAEWPADAPKPAVAPFNAAQARKHQEEWAAYLKIPVERTNSIGMKLTLIPPGEFLMGSTPEETAETLKSVGDDWREILNGEAPRHRVILTRPIYLGATEVTQAQYEKVMGRNPSSFAQTGPEKQHAERAKGLDTSAHPVEGVSWNDAVEFCSRLSLSERRKPFFRRSGETTIPLDDGSGYRLPTEAEWEFACRAGTTTRFWIGDREDDLTKVGWFEANSSGRTHAAGELRSNPFGLFDVHGNVWEWVQDRWDPAYYGQFQQKPAIDPGVPFSAGSPRVLRGAGWANSIFHCRASYRLYNKPAGREGFLGFRAALVVDDQKFE